MYEPEVFEKNNRGSWNGTKLALEKFGHLIKWKPDQSDTVLDVGCGPGNVLMGVALPVFKGKNSKVYATDITDQMVEYASKKYADVKDVQFLQLDIMDVEGFIGKYGHVDHVVSSFVVHWLPDQDTGLKNIYKLLSPGGDFFIDHTSDSPFFDIYEYMDQNAKWNMYLDNLKQFIPSSHKSKQPEQDLKDHLVKIGFTDVSVEFVPYNLTFDNEAAMKTLFVGALAQVKRIPEAMRSEYVDDVIKQGFEKKWFEVLPSREVTIVFNLFVAYGKKGE